MRGGNLNSKRPFFQHPLSSHRVLEEREKSKKRYIIESSEGEVVPGIFLSLRFKKFSVNSVVRL